MIALQNDALQNDRKMFPCQNVLGVPLNSSANGALRSKQIDAAPPKETKKHIVRLAFCLPDFQTVHDGNVLSLGGFACGYMLDTVLPEF